MLASCFPFIEYLDKKTKIFQFTDGHGYVKTPKKYCHPRTLMTSQNVHDAKLECLHNPNCHMFYDFGGVGGDFMACEDTASIQASETTDRDFYTLYTHRGNKTNGDDISRHIITKENYTNSK